MPIFYKKDGEWVEIQDAWVKVAGNWRIISEGFVKVSGVWKRFHQRRITLTVSYLRYNLNVYDYFRNQVGRDPRSSDDVTLYVKDDVKIASADNQSYALDTGTWPEGAKFTLALGDGAAILGRRGKGGAGGSARAADGDTYANDGEDGEDGGTAFKIRLPTTIEYWENKGYPSPGIYAGSGGGGGGGGSAIYDYDESSYGYSVGLALGGGGGGSGAGYPDYIGGNGGSASATSNFNATAAGENGDIARSWTYGSDGGEGAKVEDTEIGSGTLYDEIGTTYDGTSAGNGGDGGDDDSDGEDGTDGVLFGEDSTSESAFGTGGKGGTRGAAIDGSSNVLSITNVSIDGDEIN